MIFQSITVNICCYDKSPKFERKVNDLYTTQGQIIKIVWNIPLTLSGIDLKHPHKICFLVLKYCNDGVTSIKYWSI